MRPPTGHEAPGADLPARGLRRGLPRNNGRMSPQDPPCAAADSPLSWDVEGRAAYAAYAISTGGLTWNGRPMPSWDGLGPKIQTAWRRAARAAVSASTTFRVSESE